jgi:hypothetical protein
LSRGARSSRSCGAITSPQRRRLRGVRRTPAQLGGRSRGS